MRQPKLINKEIRDLEKVYLVNQKLSNQFPDDSMLKLSLQQIEYRKELLLKELEESMLFNGMHSIQYIFKDVPGLLGLDVLIDHLNSFKGLLDKTLEGVTSGKQHSLPVYFNSIFSGSYGIQLSTPAEAILFDHHYEKALGKTMVNLTDLINSSDEELNGILDKDFGDNRKLLNKYSSFFNKIHQNGERIAILWKSPISKEEKSIIVEPERAQYLYLKFSQKEKKVEPVELLGVLKGLSLIKYRVEFIYGGDGKDYIIAKFDKSLSEELKISLDRYIIANFNVTIEYNESKDELEKKYELVSFKRRG